MEQSKPLDILDVEHIFSHTEDLWRGLQNSNLFITGGTGFFGRWLLESLVWISDKLELKLEATILTRNPTLFAQRVPHLATHPRLTFLAGDVRSFQFPNPIFTHFIHAATEANAALNASQPLLMLDTIVEGTRRTLDFARQCQAKAFLLTSSGAVYGRQPSDLSHIPEDYTGGPDPTDPNSAYAQGKRLAEFLAVTYLKHYDLPVKIARCFAFVGPALPLDIHFAIGNFIRDGLRGEPIAIKGDGSPYRSYLYAADLTIWLWKILLEGQPGRPYNVGSEQAFSIAEIANQVAAAFNPQPSVQIAKTPQPGNPIERYIPSIKRASTELNLMQRVTIEEAIRRTVYWYLER